MAIVRGGDGILGAYYNKHPEPKAALRRWNQEEIPMLRLPPPGCGYTIRVGQPDKDKMQMKIRSIGGYVKINDDVIASNPSADHYIRMMVDHIRSTEKQWGYIARPRNYYLTDTFEVYIKSGDFYSRHTTVAWKCHYVVLPRSFRKKLWKLRKAS